MEKSPSPAQPSPTEKQKLDVVSHSALLSFGPGTPAGPQSSPVLRETSEGVSTELCTSSQAERNTQNGLCQAEDRQKERMRQDCLPPHPSPAFWGRSKIPKQSNQHSSKGAWPPPSPFLGSPTLHSSLSFPRKPGGPACKDDGVWVGELSLLDFVPSFPPFLPRFWLLPPAAPDQVREALGWAGATCCVSPEWEVFCHSTLSCRGSS